MVSVRFRKKLGLRDSRPVRQAEKLHWLACDLVMGALLNDEAAGCDRLSNEFAQTIYGAICVPSHIAKKFQRMAADCEAEQISFGFQALTSRRFVERYPRQQLKSRWRHEPALLGFN